MKAGSWILWSILSLLTLLFLELNHNTLYGWFIYILFAATFPVLYGRLPRGGVRFLSWIVFLAGTAGILYLSRPPVRAVIATNAKDPVPTDIVTTQYGDVMGVRNNDGTVDIFAGIPYAAPPVGELRWKAPQDPKPWSGTKICAHFAPMSMQVTNPPVIDSLMRIIGYHDYSVSLTDNFIPPVSEDSLYLNIWRPSEIHEPLPVIVYIHGGSLQTGQPWYDDYSGETMAKNGVIVVNMGYRLGVFGFLADESLLQEDGTTGNYGLLDQIKALTWVKNNIAAFGGDSGNVTLIGESAGAVCVDALCVSPLAKGLFQKAILESSTVSSVRPPHSYRSLEDALSSGKELLQKYDCSTIDQLRAIPAEELVGEMNSQHHITPDGYVFLDDPYKLRRQGIHNEAAILHGFNLEESGPFLLFDKTTRENYEEKIRNYFQDYADRVLELYPAHTDEEAAENWKRIYGVLFFNYSHNCLSRLAAANNEPSFSYLFTKTNKRLSCWHSGELVYAFGRIPETSSLYTDEDRALSQTMMQYWLRFAKTGSPNAEGLPEWAKDTGAGQRMEFGDRVQMIEDPDLRLYAILDEMQNFSLH